MSDATHDLGKVIDALASETAAFARRADIYGAPGVGVTADASAFVAKSYALEVAGVGGPALSWTVVLEGSIDGVAFTPLLTHTNALGDSTILLSGANLYPMLYFRSRVTSLSLGSIPAITVTIVGKG